MNATQELAERIENIKNDVKTDREALLRTITRLLNEKATLEAQLTAANQTITDLHEFAYERAPKIAAETADRQTADLRAEVERLCQELGHITNALAIYGNPDNWRFTHDKDNNLLWLTSLGPNYAMEILNDIAQESGEEKEVKNALL